MKRWNKPNKREDGGMKKGGEEIREMKRWDRQRKREMIKRWNRPRKKYEKMK